MEAILESDRLSILKKDGEPVYLWNGEINIYTVTKLKEVLAQLLTQCSQSCRMDLSGITECDSAGFQILVLLKKEAQIKKVRIVFENHSSAILEIMDLYGAVGLLGDKIKIPSAQRDRYSFAYGLKKQAL